MGPCRVRHPWVSQAQLPVLLPYLPRSTLFLLHCRHPAFLAQVLHLPGPFLSAGDRLNFFLQPVLRGIEATRWCSRTKARSSLSQTSHLKTSRQVSNLTVPRGRRIHAPPFLRTRAPCSRYSGACSLSRF